jgi:ribosomal protein S18 acetylase RimI-like enzyme
LIYIETGSLPDKDKLYTLLLNCEYRRFNGWPGADLQSIANYLYDDICQSGNEANLITASNQGRLVALLAYASLDWDTRHYNHKSGHIQHLLTDNSLDQTLIEKSLEHVLRMFEQRCIDSGIEFVYADLDSWDFAKSAALQTAHFKYILSRVDGFVKEKIKPIHVFDDVDVSTVRSDEIAFFEKISAQSYFRGGRFYADPDFDQARVDQMYANIVRSSYESKQILIVYRVKGQPVGLFICKRIVDYPHFSGLRVAPLRFLIVDPQFRDRKIAQDLFIHTVNYLKNSCDLVTTGLEIHNLPSLNLHTKLSYRFNYTHNAYHWWNHR